MHETAKNSNAEENKFARPRTGNIYKTNHLGNNMCRVRIRSQKESSTQPIGILQLVLSQELYRVKISKSPTRHGEAVTIL